MTDAEWQKECRRLKGAITRARHKALAAKTQASVAEENAKALLAETALELHKRNYWELVKRMTPEFEIEVLKNDLSTALAMLADWCVSLDENGTGWDDWDECYKDAMYRDGPLRSQLDKAIVEARARRG